MESDVPNTEDAVTAEKPKRKVTRAKKEVSPETEAQVEAKPKRTRRTKAQIEADKAAAEAAKAAAVQTDLLAPKKKSRKKSQSVPVVPRPKLKLIRPLQKLPQQKLLPLVMLPLKSLA